jgi:hypothetical protein
MPLPRKQLDETSTTHDAPSLYDIDFYAWTEDQAARLRTSSLEGLDCANLAEEIESVGRAEKNELRSRLIKLLSHILKWEFQPQRRGNSWQSTIGEQRTHIEGILDMSPSLRRVYGEILDRCYSAARQEASLETRLPIATFPENCPYSISEILEYAFMPGRPWMPDELGAN